LQLGAEKPIRSVRGGTAASFVKAMRECKTAWTRGFVQGDREIMMIADYMRTGCEIGNKFWEIGCCGQSATHFHLLIANRTLEPRISMATFREYDGANWLLRAVGGVTFVILRICQTEVCCSRDNANAQSRHSLWRALPAEAAGHGQL
jgi:hypothetical protein